jgi:hypothetical protein
MHRCSILTLVFTTAVNGKHAQQCGASLCQPLILRVLSGAEGPASGGAGGWVVGVVVGSGSDLSEEPAVQDVEPVTLDFVSCLIVLPGPLHSLFDERSSATRRR